MENNKKPEIEIEEKKGGGIFDDNYRLIYLIAGCGESRSPRYIMYIGLVFCVNLYLLTMCIWALVLVAPDAILIALIGNVMFSDIFCALITVSRVLTFNTLGNANRMIIAGIYEYQGEEVDENVLNANKEIVDYIRKMCYIATVALGSGYLSCLTLYPLFQIFLYDGSLNETVLNPYLPPFFFYFPFSTKTPSGYILAYIMQAVFMAVVYCQVDTYLAIHIHCTVHLRRQLEILNESIRNLQNRAYTRLKKAKIMDDHSKEQILESEEFQNCVYLCFKDNLKHHQTLLRFKKLIQPFLGACLMNVYITIALVYSSIFYIILQEVPLGVLINFVEMLLSEQSTLFVVCYLGEMVTEQHANLFESLYAVEWMHYNKKVTSSVRIMMANTLKSFNIDALIIDSPATLKTYGEIISAIYKIVNLFRTSSTSESSGSD